MRSSPAVAGGTVYVGSDRKVYALDARIVSIRRGRPRKVGAVYQFPHIDPRHRLEARP